MAAGAAQGDQGSSPALPDLRASPQCLLRLPARDPSALSPSAGGEALPTAPSWDRPWKASWCAWRVPWVPGELLCQGRGSQGLPGPPGAEPLREDQAEAPEPFMEEWNMTVQLGVQTPSFKIKHETTCNPPKPEPHEEVRSHWPTGV